MAPYRYRAVTEAGIVVTGIEDAASADAAAEKISARNLLPVEISEGKGAWALLRGVLPRRSLPHAARLRILGHLATLLESGIPLTRALHALAGQAENGRQGELLRKVAVDVENGHALTQALEMQNNLLPPLFLSMIRAGEESGNLPEVLERLVEYAEREASLRKKVTEAMIYPSIVLVIGMAVVILLLVYVVPHFMKILIDSGAPLPLPTRVLLGLSSGLRTHGLYLLAFLVFGGFAVRRMLAIPRWGRRKDRVVLALPLLGNVVRKAAVARFAKTMATLLESGIPILQAFRLVGPTLGNLVLNEANERIRISIETGADVTSSIEKESLFPPMAAEMVAVGESSGNMDGMLKKIGVLFDKEVEEATKRITLVLEPMLILVLGVVVGFVALALILPMLKAVSTMG